MNEPGDTSEDKDSEWLVDLIRLAMLEKNSATLPPLTRRALYTRGATAKSVMEQLAQEIVWQPFREALLHPQVKRLLENHCRQKNQHLHPETPAQKAESPTPQKPAKRTPRSDVSFKIDREPFFQVGRALQRGLGKGKLGHVTFSVEDGVLTIESDWGGSRIPCSKGRAITATISGRAFCALVTTRYREKQPSGQMTIVFRPKLKEIGIDLIGVKAEFGS